jgi:hypothetical protein
MNNKEILIEVGVDVGGSGTKISVQRVSAEDLTSPIWFSNKTLFSDKRECGQRIAKAILSVAAHHFEHYLIHNIAIGMTIKTTSDSCRIDSKKFKRLDIPMASLIWLEPSNKTFRNSMDSIRT